MSPHEDWCVCLSWRCSAPALPDHWQEMLREQMNGPTWHRGQQLRHLPLPKSSRLQSNPPGPSAATGWELKCKREHEFSKSLKDISLRSICQHICIGTIFSTLLKIMRCFRYYHYSDISRYIIKIFTAIFIILEEEMGYMITYLQYKN